MQFHRVKVCKGPNCKAWCSDRIARELRKTADISDFSEIKVCRVPCMDACHGGVSVRIGCKGKVLKLKEAEEVLTILGASNESVAC
jgi:NADH:ubiquinone oxidoreductase subunit E